MDSKRRMGVSIICVTYNHAKFIEKTINAILMQKTEFPYEIIIHDDMSTDGTIEILQKYQKRYPDKIRLLLEKENQYSKGKSLLKICFPEVRGKYIALTDGDDEWIYNEKLQEQYNLMEQNPNVSLCLHNVIRYNIQTGEEDLQINNRGSGILTKKEIILEPQGRAPTTAFFFRSEYISEIPEFSYAASVEDDPIKLYYACRGDIFYINKIWAVRNFMHKESWNYKMNNISFKIHYIKKYLLYLVNFNDYSQKKYDVFLQEKIYNLCFEAIEILQPENLDKDKLYNIINVFSRETEGRFSEKLKEIYKSMLPRCMDYLDREIELFIEQCWEKNEKLYLYGTGKIAQYFAEKIKYRGFSFAGFVVSDNYKKADFFMNKRVWRILEVDREKSYIWLTLNEKNTKEVLTNIKNMGYRHVLYKDFETFFSWRCLITENYNREV